MTTRSALRASSAAAAIAIGLLAVAGVAVAATGTTAGSVRITGADNRDFIADGIRVNGIRVNGADSGVHPPSQN